MLEKGGREGGRGQVAPARWGWGYIQSLYTVGHGKSCWKVDGINDGYDTTVRTAVYVWSWKTLKGYGKGHGILKA